MEGALALVGKKVLALNGLTPDQQDICSATLSLLCERNAIYIGYARVSTREQNLALQQDALTRAGCKKIIVDRVGGTVAERPGLAQIKELLRAGDTLASQLESYLRRTERWPLHIVAETE
jgi:Resolvase, N terminal domain